jgi:PhnB protein
MKAKPIPDGYAAVTPYLIVQGVAQAIEFYKKAFNATERMRLPMPDGKIAHAEIEIGGSVVMMGEENPQMGAKSPKTLLGSPVTIHLYVEDVDAIFRQAVSAGATVVRPVQNMFYGDRSGGLSDPFGHLWYVASHVEDVPPQEIAQRAAAMAPKR